jgi:hypothetical protein
VPAAHVVAGDGKVGDPVVEARPVMTRFLSAIPPLIRVLVLSLQILWIDVQLLWNRLQWFWCNR